jgi:hypothetical protein
MIVVLIGYELNVSISRARHDRTQRLRLYGVGWGAARDAGS